MRLVFENPAFLVGFLVAAALLLAVAFFTTRNSRFVLGIFACGIAVVLLLLCDWLVTTPGEHVAELLDDLAAAGRNREAEVLIDAVDRGYKYRGLTHDALAGLIRRELAAYQPSSLALNGLWLESEGDEIVARFVAVTSGSYHGHPVNHYPVRLAVTFRQQGDRWLIHRIQRYEPITNTDSEIDLGEHR
jgi:hypothetical protein